MLGLSVILVSLRWWYGEIVESFKIHVVCLKFILKENTLLDHSKVFSIALSLCNVMIIWNGSFDAMVIVAVL